MKVSSGYLYEALDRAYILRQMLDVMLIGSVPYQNDKDLKASIDSVDRILLELQSALGQKACDAEDEEKSQ